MIPVCHPKDHELGRDITPRLYADALSRWKAKGRDPSSSSVQTMVLRLQAALGRPLTSSFGVEPLVGYPREFAEIVLAQMGDFH